MAMMRALLRKIGPRRPLHAQVMFTALAFLAMVTLSYFFVRNIVYHNLIRHTESVLSFEQAKVESDLMEHKTPVEFFGWTIRDMILYGVDAAHLQNYINEISDYLGANEKHKLCFNGFSGYFETFPDGPVFMTGRQWNVPEDLDPSQRPWYHAAIAANGKVAETLTFLDIISRETILVYSLCIFDDEGRRLGVINLRIRVNAMGKEIVSTALAQGGYGMLLDQNLVMIAHPNAAFVGVPLRDLNVAAAGFEDELKKGIDISKRPVISSTNEATIAFFRKLSNGWYLGLLTPKGPYYQSVTNMMIFLGALGIILAAALILILFRIDAARDKSDKESRHKSAFLANMSHEIRTPMNAIIGMTTLGKSAPDIERKDYCFSKIEGASHHLLGVINDILDMSKIEANKFELSPAEFNFEKMLQQVVNVVNFRIEGKKQKFTVNIDPDIPRVLVGDDQRLAQVITNLLGNACKFTPENGSIGLYTRLLGEENDVCTLQVSVSDTGIGIRPEDQKRLFSSFEQAESSTTRKFGGTGLGLAISKSIVGMMGGRIWVDSELGKGSTFTFTVRVKRGAVKEQVSEVPVVQTDITGLFAGYHILLAEDVEINREIVLALLEPTQLKIDCAVNGAQAVQMFAQAPAKYDMILMDVQMPEMDGYEATRRIRALEYPEARAIRIIAMTANVFREDIEKCLEAGMDNHLGKPLDFNELLEKLRTYLPYRKGT